MSGAPTMRSIEAGHRTLLGKRCPLRAGLLSSPLSPFPHITIKCIKPVLLLLVGASLVACSATLPITYAPSNLSRGSGSIAVEQFIYAAARRGKVPVNQLKNEASGRFTFRRILLRYSPTPFARNCSFLGTHWTEALL